MRPEAFVEHHLFGVVAPILPALEPPAENLRVLLMGAT